MNLFRLIIAGLAVFILLTSGIIRHDVDQKKYIDLAHQESFDCVGQILIDSGPGGSCVLIRANYIVTAAHVLIESDYTLDTIKMDDQIIVINKPGKTRVVDVTKIQVSINGQTRKAKRLILHPNYLKKNTSGTCDIALIELAEPFEDFKEIFSSLDLFVSF